MGHSKAVRDVTFTNEGKRFLSAAYDRQIKLWDTETGESRPTKPSSITPISHPIKFGPIWYGVEGHCVQAFSNGKIPYCVKFHPDPDKQHIFLAGMSDKKIIQVIIVLFLTLHSPSDRQLAANAYESEYARCSIAFFFIDSTICGQERSHRNTTNISVQCKIISPHHFFRRPSMSLIDVFFCPGLPSISNTITFVDENRRFVTTSDDKTIRAWDFDIPVVIKYIAEPAMHSMPAVGIHPNSKRSNQFRFFFLLYQINPNYPSPQG